MTKLLYIQASPRHGASRSIAVADAYLAALRVSDPTLEVDTLELWDAGLPEFDGNRNEAKLKAFFYNDAHLVRFEPNRIELRLNPAVPANFSGEVMQRLRDWTGERWTIVVSKSEGAPTLAEQEKVARADSKNRAADHPLVKAALAAFPGAELVKVQPLHVPTPVAVPDLPATDPDRASADLDYNEDAAADFMESFDA